MRSIFLHFALWHLAMGIRLSLSLAFHAVVNDYACFDVYARAHIDGNAKAGWQLILNSVAAVVDLCNFEVVDLEKLCPVAVSV